MPEPMRARLRPTTMMRALLGSLMAVVLVAGCGSATKSDPGSAPPAEETATASPSPSPSPTGTPSVPADEPPVSESYEIEVPGQPTALKVTQQNHPRGGFQVRVFGADGGAFSELRVDGRPLVPFVATDVQEHPLSVDCQNGGVVVTDAVAHEPAGVAFAWDVRQTTYAVDGTEVTRGPTVEVADNVLPKQLEAKYPELLEHTMFTSCRSS